MWQAWVNGIIGVYIFVVAFFGYGTTGNLWNDIIVGIVAAAIGFSMIKEKPWQGWLGAIVGIWLIIAAFIPSLLTFTGNEWNLIISGVLLMVAGFGALGKTSSGTTTTTNN